VLDPSSYYLYASGSAATETPYFSTGNGLCPLFVEGCRNPILSKIYFRFKIVIVTLLCSLIRLFRM
ncbi:MAG: hypothetical protein IKH55_13625, partial [Fibrobacter sp.]|nr:hypothetical protein [Fibrobacter sp.]